MAEGVGFEPTDPCGSPVFKTGALNHSAIPPSCSLLATYVANSSPRIRLDSDLVANCCQIPGNMRTKANGTPRVPNITVYGRRGLTVLSRRPQSNRDAPTPVLQD